MHYLYGSRDDLAWKLAATFDSQQQLLNYVRWATLQELPDGRGKFEQGSALVGFSHWRQSQSPLTSEAADEVPHNPSPSML